MEYFAIKTRVMQDITFYRRYLRELLPIGKCKKKKTGDLKEYWFRYNPFSKKRYMVFRYSSSFGFGAVIPILMQCFEYAEAAGFIPLVEYNDIENLVNVFDNHKHSNYWDMVFEQTPIERIENLSTIFVGGINVKYTSERIKRNIFNEPKETHYEDLYATNNWRNYFCNANRYYRKWFHLKEAFEDRLQEEWNSMVESGECVLGIMLREEFSISRDELAETDPLRKHPLVPNVYALIARAKEVYKETKSKKIYVGSIFQDSIDLFKECFGEDAVICCSRKRGVFADFLAARERLSLLGHGQDVSIEERFARENMEYVGKDVDAMVGYFRDIYFLSRCTNLIGVTCGGTRMAMILNGGKYNYYECIR